MDTDEHSPASGRNQRLETTNHTNHTNAGAGTRFHLCALVQAVNELEIQQEAWKALAGT